MNQINKIALTLAIMLLASGNAWSASADMIVTKIGAVYMPAATTERLRTGKAAYMLINIVTMSTARMTDHF